MKPPNTGPRMNPNDTDMAMYPIPFPVSCEGNASVTMAMLQDMVMAAPTAWRARERDQLPDALGQGTGQEPHGEDAHTQGVDPLATDRIADLADDEHRTGADQDVGHGHPHDGGDVRPEHLGERGEGDIRDARVHGRHDVSHGHRGEGLPLVGAAAFRGRMCDGVCGHGVVWGVPFRECATQHYQSAADFVNVPFSGVWKNHRRGIGVRPQIIPSIGPVSAVCSVDRVGIACLFPGVSSRRREFPIRSTQIIAAWG